MIICSCPCKDFSRYAEVNEPFPAPLSQLDYYMMLQRLAVNTFNSSKYKDQVDGKTEDMYYQRVIFQRMFYVG